MQHNKRNKGARRVTPGKEQQLFDEEVEILMKLNNYSNSINHRLVVDRTYDEVNYLNNYRIDKLGDLYDKITGGLERMETPLIKMNSKQ
jgi:hypothetical protein